MVKKVIVKSGTVFNTLTAANAYHRSLCQTTEIGDNLTEPDRYDVLDSYHRYCEITNWDGEVKNAVDVVLA